MGLLEEDDLIHKEYNKKTQFPKSEIDDIITNLQLYSNNKEMLTKEYTKILMDDNVMYILTRISQNEVFKMHFPEFYQKNKYGESVINCQQNTVYHRYGVFKHILYTVENVGKDSLKFNYNELKILKWTMFLHDVGKPMAKMINGTGTDSFAGHDDLSVTIATNILNRFDFKETDKKIILTLIKYHDKYLNEGELTYDNLSFLAKELDDKKHLFYMLLEVKCADNKAKSIDVYNKFINVQKKYYEFIAEYFGNEYNNRLYNEQEQNEIDEYTNSNYKNNSKNKNKKIPNEYAEGGSDGEITEEIIVNLCSAIEEGKRLKCYYQPIIDLKNIAVDGYEVFYKILTDENFSYKQIMRKAKDVDKYDDLQQMLFVNALNEFNSLHPAATLTQYINIDAKSYENCIKKSEIFDAIAGKKVVIDFNNIEMLSISVLKDMSNQLHKIKVDFCIDNLGFSNNKLKDIEKIEPKVVKYKLEKTDGNTKKIIQELVSFCTAREIKLIVFGIDSKEKLNYIIDLGVKYAQGEYFSNPLKTPKFTKTAVKKLIDLAQEDLIF